MFYWGMPRRGGRHGVTHGTTLDALTMTLKGPHDKVCMEGALILTCTRRRVMTKTDTMLIMHEATHEKFAMF
eukprot:12383206-Karenia_brevis.AAC.1